jgi:hypothetical protein
MHSHSSQQSEDEQSDQSVERRSAPSSSSQSRHSAKAESSDSDKEFVEKIKKDLQFGNEDLGIDLEGLEAQCPEALLQYEKDSDKGDGDRDGQNPERRHQDSSSDSDESSSGSGTDYEPPVIYEHYGMRVLQFTDIFFPQKEK